MRALICLVVFALAACEPESGADGLLGYLQKQDHKVLTTLSRKMIGYALGRNPLASDRRLIGEMLKAGGDATFTDLATRVITSRQFRNRVGDDGAPAATTKSATANQPPQLITGVR